MKEFLKTTIIGGVVFLVPVALLLAALGHALRVAVKVVQPVSSGLHLDQIGKIAGIGIVTVLAVVLLILVSFIAGLVARTKIGSRVSAWFESSFFESFPQYQTFKSVAQGLEQIESAYSGLKPALISTEGGWQIGYLLEPLENDWVAVFIPQAPTPTTGNIRYFPTGRVRILDIPMLQATEIVKNLGVGSRAALKGADLDIAGGRPR
jgi:uncharacterized membrane protein